MQVGYFELDQVPSPEKMYVGPIGADRKSYLEEEEISNHKIAELEKSPSSEYVDHPLSPSARYPILFVDVNLGEDKVERLTVLEGDSAETVAKDFWIKHGLNDKMQEKLEIMLQDQMDGILDRINEEEEDSKHIDT